MLLRLPVLCSIAAAVSLGLSSTAIAAAPRPAPLKIDFSLTPAQIDASCKSEIDAAGKRVDAMLHARSRRTFKTVAEPLENIISDLGDNLAAQTFLFNVAPDKAVRDASERCNTAVSGYQAELFARPDLYAALDAAAKSHTAVGTAQKKLLDIHLVNARRSGAGLPPEQRTRRLAGMLARKGYPAGLAFRVIREALEAEGDLAFPEDELSFDEVDSDTE